MKRRTRFLLALATFLFCEYAAALAPQRSHKLYMRQHGEYLLVAQNQSRMQWDGLSYTPISQTRFQSYYLSIANGSADTHLVSSSDPALLSPDWKEVDQRAVWLESTDEGKAGTAELLMLIQGERARDPSHVFKMPRQETDVPQLVAQVKSETLGVSIDLQSQARLSLRDMDGDDKTDLLIQRPGGLVPVFLSDILSNQSQLQVPKNPKPKSEKLSSRDRCGFRLQHPAGSAGVMFSRSCQTAYVLPPEDSVETRVSPEPAVCQELKTLLNQAQAALPSEEKGGLASLDAGASKSALDILSQIREKSAEEVAIETRYSMKWGEAVAQYRELNRNSPIQNWEKLPITRVEVDTKPIARVEVNGGPLVRSEVDKKAIPLDVNDFVVKRSISPSLACGETLPASRSVRFIYRPWFERTATVDLIKVFTAQGFYQQNGTIAYSWLSRLVNVENSFIAFGEDDADFSFGTMEQDIMRETLKVALEKELKKLLENPDPASGSEESPEYLFNDCNWFSETPCQDQFWIGDTDGDSPSRSSIQHYFSDSRAIAVLRYFRSDLLQIERSLAPAYQPTPKALEAAIALDAVPADPNAIDLAWPASVAEEKAHAVDIYQNNPNEFDHADPGFYNSKNQGAMPSTRIDCSTVQHPGQFNRVHFSEDCGLAFLAPKSDLQPKRQETTFLNGDVCPTVDGLVSRRVAIQRVGLEKIQRALSQEEIEDVDRHLKSAQEEYNEVIHEVRRIDGAVQVYDFSLYDAIEPYVEANPQFVWHHLPISNLDFSSARVPDVRYDSLLSEQDASVTVRVGMETACGLRNAEPKAMQIAVLPVLSAKYTLSSKVRVKSFLKYKGELSSLFTTFDMDFFFISLRLNLLNTQNLEHDFFSLTIDSYGTDLSITERNRLYLEESYKLMKKLNDAYYDNFQTLLGDAGPNLTSRKPTVQNKDEFKRIVMRANEACDENDLQDYSESLMDAHCYPKHLVSAMTEILTNENLFRAITLFQDNAATEEFIRSHFVQRKITMGVVP
ncbi:hypothetical protein [Oligoflexus tunisiensis]|uniref:hypothetical protein n=1 Tax=Oligoflexus tunisiensis TaxID=708132 RepID=UPI00114D250C|nr:hypothetical protein [Oligoflexus tunisiensis]